MAVKKPDAPVIEGPVKIGAMSSKALLLNRAARAETESRILEAAAEIQGTSAVIGEVMSKADSLAVSETITPSLIQELSMRFIRKRMDAAITSEEIRAEALAKMRERLPNDANSMPKLLRIVEGLGDQGAVDMANIIAASKPSPGDKQPGGRTNIFNFGAVEVPSAGAPGEKAGVKPEVLGLLGDLLQISESVISSLNDSQPE